MLLSRDPDATRALFTPAVIDYFVQHGGYGVTTDGTSMMVDRSQSRTIATVEQIESLVNDATSIARSSSTRASEFLWSGGRLVRHRSSAA